MTTDRDDTEFWALAAPPLEHVGVTRSTMMGYPCLRLDGDFFASWDPGAARLIVKLDATSVIDLIERRASSARELSSVFTAIWRAMRPTRLSSAHHWSLPCSASRIRSSAPG